MVVIGLYMRRAASANSCLLQKSGLSGKAKRQKNSLYNKQHRSGFDPERCFDFIQRRGFL